MARAGHLLALTTLLAMTTATHAAETQFANPLPEEPVPSVATLPERYPDSYVYVHDLHFNSLPDGRAAIVDVSSPAFAVKGQVPVAQFGNILPSTTGSEIYVAETFYSRMTRGERTDTISIWDKKTLTNIGEIVLPGNKRGHSVTIKNSLQFTNGERWALVFNFTPGASVTVVDLPGRTILGEIELPGCSHIYPTGARGFSSLCADGTVTSIALDEKGGVRATKTTKAINDIDNDPWFMMPAKVGNVSWFVSFKGRLHGLDLSGDAARDLGAFAMIPGKPTATGWRPGGWQVITSDPSGMLYVLMDPNGAEGTHKNGGTEVWVADPAKKAVVRKITLANHVVSIEATGGASPYLVAGRPDGSLDVYEAATGKFLHTVVDAVHDPLTMTASGR